MSDLRTDRGSRPVPSEGGVPASSRKTITAVIALAAVAAFGVGIWFAYDQGVKRGSSGAPPLIRAEQGPVKVAPENPGGLQVPNQDKEIYDRIGGDNAQQTAGAPQPERLLPPPEQPKVPPTPKQNAATASAAGASGSPAVTVPTRPAAATVPNQSPSSQTIPNQTAAPSPAAVQPQQKAEDKPAAKPEPEKKQVAAAPAAPKAVASPGGSVKIQLASLKDQAQAQSTWAQLHKKYADILGDLTPSYEKVEIPNKGTFVRLQAGPLKDRAAAQALCQKLAAKNQGCIVVR